MDFSTCDLCDANETLIGEGALTVLPPVFKPFGKHAGFSGQAATLKVFEDNVITGQNKYLVLPGAAPLGGAPPGGGAQPPGPPGFTPLAYGVTPPASVRSPGRVPGELCKSSTIL